MSYGGQKHSLAAAGNTLSWPSHVFDLFLVHLDLGEVGFIDVSLVPATLWYQHMHSSGALGLLAMAPQQKTSPVLCMGSLLDVHPLAHLCCATSAWEVTQ